jgi:hypothetical protein
MPKKSANLQTSSQSLEALCEELLRTKPNQEKVRQLMTDNEIQYTSDPIQQLATVLQRMDQTKSKTKQSDRTAEL